MTSGTGHVEMADSDSFLWPKTADSGKVSLPHYCAAPVSDDRGREHGLQVDLPGGWFDITADPDGPAAGWCSVCLTVLFT